MRILITGPTGSGKTTQATLLASHLSLCFLGVGRILRQVAKKDTKVARAISKAFEKGVLADDRVVAGVVRDRLKAKGCKGFVIDGFPRSLGQLKFLDPKYDLVFFLKVSDEVAIKRLLGRGRKDDKLQLVEKRLKIYHQITEPAVDYYRQQGVVHEVDGSKDLAEVQRGIREIADEHSAS